MGFNSNSSDTAVVTEGKLYTGLKNMKVVAINPTKEELEKMGYNPKNDPVYTSVDNTDPQTPVEKVRLDFFLEAEMEGQRNLRTKIAFFLENRHRTNRDGTTAEWIDNTGRTAWGTPDAAPTQYNWFDTETARKCHPGEGDLHQFLVNWLNIQPGDEAKLDNFVALFAGNYTELQSLLASNAGNEVKVLLTVREGKYQAAYSRYFDRATNKRTGYWEQHIRRQSEEGYPIKEDFSNSLAFQEWTEPTMLTDMGGNSGQEEGEGSGSDGNDPF